MRLHGLTPTYWYRCCVLPTSDSATWSNKPKAMRGCVALTGVQIRQKHTLVVDILDPFNLSPLF
jgi:hypothetical protein